MIYLGWILAAVATAAFVVQTVRLAKTLPRADLNVINGIVLPMPDDPRWKLERGGDYPVLALGDVKVRRAYERWEVCVGGVGEIAHRSRANRYARAVERSYMQATALASVERST